MLRRQAGIVGRGPSETRPAQEASAEPQILSERSVWGHKAVVKRGDDHPRSGLEGSFDLR